MSVADSLKVVIVDDDEPVRGYVDRALRRSGFRPERALNGAEGLRAACRMARLDLLVTDLMMPGMSGEEMVRQVRRYHPHVKVLYLSGAPDRLREKTRGLLDGEACLPKPCTIVDLEQAVSRLLSRRLDDRVRSELQETVA